MRTRQGRAAQPAASASVRSGNAKSSVDPKKAQAEEAKRRAAKKKKQQKELERRKKAAERMRRYDERFELTDEEKAIRAKMQREERSYRNKQRVKAVKIFVARFVMFVLMFAVLLSISVGAFYWNLVYCEPSARMDFSYKVGSAKTMTVDRDIMLRGGTLYLNMTPIVDLFELAVTGDTTELRYISRTDGEHVKFTIGSTQVFINGVEERLTAAPFLDGNDLYVPADFFESFAEGIAVSYDTSSNRVTVSRVAHPDKANTYIDLRFVIRPDVPLIALDEYNEFGNTSPVEFVADLDVYESFMNPKNRDDYLILVNGTYPLPKSYVPQTIEISDIRRDGRPLQYLDNVAEKAAHAMIMELEANGHQGVNILLGYRSYDKQKNYYNQEIKAYMETMSEEKAKLSIASRIHEAGCNPQQAGLSIVMHNLEETSSAFAREAAYAYLAENCWKFGFIIRYPSDKVSETGMEFQPYFFTYVGRYHAMRIWEQGLSMEEYIAQLEQKGYFGMSYENFRTELLNRANQ